MGKRKITLLVLLVVLCIGAVSYAGWLMHASREAAAHKPGVIYVMFKKGTTQEEIVAINESFGVEVVDSDLTPGFPPMYYLRLPPGLEVEAAIEAYKNNPRVQLAQPVGKGRIIFE